MTRSSWSLLLMCVVGCAKSEPKPTDATPPVVPPAPALTTPAAVATQTPTSSAAPAREAAPTTYAVFGVAADDVLNVRSEPDPKSKKVYSYGPSVSRIAATGRQVVAGDVPWVEVSFEGGSGWVNRHFVREVVAGGGCNDAALTAVIRKVMRAVALSDGAALQDATSPLRGILVRQSPSAPSVRVPASEAGSVFTSAVTKNWGPQSGSFKSVILPSLREDVAGKGAKEVCGKLLSGDGAELEFPAELAGLTLVSFHRAATGAEPWHTTVGGLEYVDGKPYLAALVQYQGAAQARN